jgi:hypothetical protein
VGVALSRNTVCAFLQRLGQDGAKRGQFYRLRMDAVAAEHHIAVDGTLKQDTSMVYPRQPHPPPTTRADQSPTHNQSRPYSPANW